MALEVAEQAEDLALYVPQYTLMVQLWLDSLNQEYATFKHPDGRTTLTIDRDTWVQAGRLQQVEIPITERVSTERRNAGSES